MGEIVRWDSPVFTEAVLVWTGWGQHMMPRRDDAFVVSRFGAESAAQLLPAIRSLTEAFYASDAKYTAPSLAEMGAMAAEEFKKKHPEVADEVVKALAWCYTFDFR